jgi:diacylglycerol kinase
MPNRTQRPAWWLAFWFAGRGIIEAVREERHLKIHLACASAAIVAGCYWHLAPLEWLMLSGTIALVLAAELVNSSLERLARAITSDQNDWVRSALDMAAGAVLIAALHALVVAVFLFGPRLWRLLDQ